MTHEELIEVLEHTAQDGMADEPVLKALRAVVELHKPFMYDGRFGQFERCSGCASEEEWLGEIYPCPTIQAIAIMVLDKKWPELPND